MSGFSSTPVDLPENNALTPRPGGHNPALARRAYQISEKEARLLQGWLSGLPDLEACQDAGYTPGSVASARRMVYDVLGKIDQAAGSRETFIAAGLGMTKWLKTLKRVIDDDNPRFLVIALKLWGVALGIFSDQQSTQGAQISINVMGNDHGTRARESQMVQINIDGQTIEMPAIEAESGDA